MRAAQLYEEAEATGNDAEFSLGIGSLIGIFFGLALLCGIFFGFGYRLGHRSPPANVSSEPLYASPQPKSVAVAPKPSAQVLEQPENASRVVFPNSAIPKPSSESETASPVPSQSAQPARAFTAAAKTQPEPRVANIAPTPIAMVTPTGTIMVQIAAVKSRSDAEALSVALHKNGFNPTVRSEGQDKLLHVQVGPFENREDAKTMRQKLSNAGYNAFIK